QEGVRGRRDGKGQTHYLTVGGKTIGDVQLNTNGEQRLHVYSGFTPTGGALHPVFGGGLPGEGASHSEVVPETPTEALGVYRVQAGDDLERVALQVYGDSSLWYLIADANGLTARDKGLHSGQRLVIPPAAASHHTAGTHRVVSAREVLGEVSASLPSALSPPTSPVSQGHKPHSLFKKMVVAAVAVVSVVLIAAAIATLAGAG
ncbi:LysM peptidoglycan-binding domain-containing protein, partial [Legionella fairfieldensis]|uniref:LysM peptidoglycan-binding domain-containing protein n=1 Tax=Legionella fairfieldensis TaxID=45064 RepID=UPI001A9475C3